LEVEGTRKSLNVDGRMMFAGKKYMFSRYGTGRRQQGREKFGVRRSRRPRPENGSKYYRKKCGFSTSDCHLTEIKADDCHVHNYRMKILKNAINITSGFQESKRQWQTLPALLGHSAEVMKF
jgi:hypothetical protein